VSVLRSDLEVYHNNSKFGDGSWCVLWNNSFMKNSRIPLDACILYEAGKYELFECEEWKYVGCLTKDYGIFGVGKSDDIFIWNMEKEHSTSRSYRRYNMKTVWTHLVWHLSIL